MNVWKKNYTDKGKTFDFRPDTGLSWGSMDMNRTNEARDMTKKLADLAEKYQCTIVLVGHMNKAAGNKVAYRGMGYINFFAIARSVLLVGRVEEEKNIRAVVRIKNNLAGFGHPKAFELSANGFDEDERWQLPEPGALMSAKAYKDKKAVPLVEQLKEVIKALTIKCVQLAEQRIWGMAVVVSLIFMTNYVIMCYT